MDTQLLWGTIDMLILEVISQGPTYGYEITQTVAQRSQGQFELKEGSLYPALHRLERQKQLASFWQEVDGRRRKYYKLTAAGQKALASKKQEWFSYAQGVKGILGDSSRIAPSNA
ncbi:MAG: PadR family transcriptional regulator [Planctomycetales bacterium]